MYFIDRCHQQGIGVLLDWTPAHFPRDSHGLAQFDGTHLFETRHSKTVRLVDQDERGRVDDMQFLF